MTEIERKALALLNECAGQEVYGGWKTFDPNQSPCTRALCRAVEQHEQFKREVSDAIIDCGAERYLSRFILPKPVDPLVEALDKMLRRRGFNPATEVVADEAAGIRAELAARGLEIREIEG